MCQASQDTHINKVWKHGLDEITLNCVQTGCKIVLQEWLLVIHCQTKLDLMWLHCDLSWAKYYSLFSLMTLLMKKESQFAEFVGHASWEMQ